MVFEVKKLIIGLSLACDKSSDTAQRYEEEEELSQASPPPPLKLLRGTRA
jgi:hypothetical protein